MEPKHKDLLMYALGVCIVLCAVLVIVLLVYVELPAGNRDLVNIALGSLLSMAVSVTSYFFGSSRGSAHKTEALEATTRQLMEHVHAPGAAPAPEGIQG